MPMQVSGPISMDQLRAEFKDTTSGSVSMSELTRGDTFIKNELFVDPSSTIKTANSNMAMSDYYNTTKGREKRFAFGAVEEFTIPANMNRVIFWVQGSGGGSARRTGCGDPARRARGGGGGGYIACNLLQNHTVLTWQNLPATIVGGKILGVSGIGGAYAASGSTAAQGQRGQASELCFVPPGVTAPSLAGTVYENISTRLPNNSNYLLFVTAQGGQGARATCSETSLGAGGSSKAVWNSTYAGGVTQAYYRTPQQNSRFGSNAQTTPSYYYTGFCDENNNQGPGMNGVGRSSNSVDNICGFGSCFGRIGYGGEPGWILQDADQIFSTAARNPTQNFTCWVVGTQSGNFAAAVSPEGHGPASQTYFSGWGGDADAYLSTGNCYEEPYDGSAGTALIKY